MGSSGGNKVEKISLKIQVDLKSKKVVFAEAGSDFVDFIFTILTLQLSTVTKLLLNDEKVAGGMVGSLGSLYKSIESLGVQYFVANRNKDSVLKPPFPAVVPLLSLDGEINLLYESDHPRTTYKCFNCSSSLTSRPYATKTCINNPSKNPVYVKEAVAYIVMDNLEVKPMSFSLFRTLVKDFDYLEEQHVQFGVQEGLALLKASLEKQNVLTTVFLGKKK